MKKKKEEENGKNKIEENGKRKSGRWKQKEEKNRKE